MSDIAVDRRALSAERPRAFETIALGGLIVAILDGLFAFTFYGQILGINRLRIFQGVAAGLLGPTVALSGGVKTFVLGLFLHFIVATCIATIYYLATQKLPVLIQHPVVSGLIYGMIAYLGMKFVVTPLSAIGRRPVPRLSIFLTEIIGHAFLVGLPIALVARWSANRSRRSKAIGLRQKAESRKQKAVLPSAFFNRCNLRNLWIRARSRS